MYPDHAPRIGSGSGCLPTFMIILRLPWAAPGFKPILSAPCKVAGAGAYARLDRGQSRICGDKEFLPFAGSFGGEGG